MAKRVTRIVEEASFNKPSSHEVSNEARKEMKRAVDEGMKSHKSDMTRVAVVFGILGVVGFIILLATIHGLK